MNNQAKSTICKEAHVGLHHMVFQVTKNNLVLEITLLSSYFKNKY